jgi:hypothetical protein
MRFDEECQHRHRCPFLDIHYRTDLQFLHNEECGMYGGLA